MYIGIIQTLNDLKSEPNDLDILYQIASESGLYSLWQDDKHYRFLSNFMKYRFGILVRQGYVFCKNDFACRIVIEFTSVPYGKVLVMKGFF